jgi:hypothetical protein
MNALSLSSSLVMQFLGDVSRMDVHVLLDTVASHCYLNSSYARRIGLHVKEDNRKVVLGNGLEVELEKSVNVHVKIQQYQFQVSCLVTKLSDGFNLILGNNWLNKHRAHIDFTLKACKLRKCNKKITIRMNTSKRKFKLQDKIFFALQFKRAIKKGCQPLLVHLKKIKSGESLEKFPMESISLRMEDSFVNLLIKEYEDNFQPISPCLPHEKKNSSHYIIRRRA